MSSVEKLKQLREETGSSISECKKALSEAQDDLEKAKVILREWGKDFAEKKTKREAGQGIIDTYIHPGKKIGVIIELRCESDFVAKNEDFQKLAHELCLQIAALPQEETEVLEQPWIRDESKTVKELINEYIAKFGENIILKRFARYEL